MRVYWCAHCGEGANFGDQLTPMLLEHAGIPCTYAPAAEAELVMVGSILSAVPNRWRGTVLGTGFIKRGMVRDLRFATVLAVRGELTRRAARLPRSVPLGDLGVLAPQLGDGRPMAPIPELALPHYVDDRLAARHPGATVLPMTSPPLELIAAVAASSVVYSSSLHGIILADALGVPHVWELHPGVRGQGWKFHDYATALDEDLRPGVERLSDRGAMAELVNRAASWLGDLAGQATRADTARARPARR